MFSQALDLIVCPYCCGLPQVDSQECLEEPRADGVNIHILVQLHCPECEALYSTLLYAP